MIIHYNPDLDIFTAECPIPEKDIAKSAGFRFCGGKCESKYRCGRCSEKHAMGVVILAMANRLNFFNDTDRKRYIAKWVKIYTEREAPADHMHAYDEDGIDGPWEKEMDRLINGPKKPEAKKPPKCPVPGCDNGMLHDKNAACPDPKGLHR